MNNTILQVPIDKKLRDKAAKTANQQGFSSLQEVVRIFLNQLAKKEISVSFTSPVIELTRENDDRYAYMLDEVVSGKVKTKTFSDTSSLMQYLHDR